MATAKRTTTTVEEDVDPDAIAVPVVTAPPEPQQQAPSPDNGPRVLTLTEEELMERIEQARKQEKDKLYPRLDEQAQTLKRLQDDLEARQASEAAAQQAAQEAQEAKEREELSAKELLAQAEARFQAELASVRGELETRDAMFAKEQEFQQLSGYRQQLVSAALAENPLAIADEFLDYVGGNTPEEIQQSLAMAMQKTASIVAQVQGAQQRTRQQAKGTSVTQPPVGPMETDQAYEMMSPGDISSMSMEEYAKRRPQLLQAASRARTGAQ